MRVGSAIVALAVLAVVCLGPRPALADPSTDPCGSIQVQPDGTIDAAPLIGWLQSNYPDMSLDAVLQIVGDTLSLCSVSNPALAGSIQGGDSGLVVPVVTGPVTPPPGIALGTGCGDSGEASCCHGRS